MFGSEVQIRDSAFTVYRTAHKDRICADANFAAHPFTVANSAELDALNGTSTGLTLYAKNAGDFTAHLNRTAHCIFLNKATEKPISSSVKLSIEGAQAFYYSPPISID